MNRWYCKINANPLQDNIQGSSVFVLADSHLDQIQLNMLNGNLMQKKVSRMALLKKTDATSTA